MAIWDRSILGAVLTLGAVLCLIAGTARSQQPKPADPPPNIVQPGAPGQATRTLSASNLASSSRSPLPADVSFMQGMIHHHAQAVEMVDLLRTRGKSPELKALGERISISQTDEIRFMKQWLTDRGQPAPTETGHMDHMAGMDHVGHNMAGMDHMNMQGMQMPLMPGMLTPEQMKALAAAKGAQFDHLFLTGMIQHHTGALIMVDDLFNEPAAGQDPVLFDFASDIDNTQRAEISIMRGMLEKEKH